MKVMIVLGTRPEIIRLSRVIPMLDDACTHRLVHTGQNYDPNLSDVFFRELGVRAPDVALVHCSPARLRTCATSSLSRYPLATSLSAAACTAAV